MDLCNLKEFSDKIDANALNPLREATIELTRRCNFDCQHCYCVSKSLKSNKELSLADWERILQECAEEGLLFLTVSGGEPILHPKFREIWKIAKQLGFLITLFSNGVLIDDELADFLADWTPVEVSITVYGASEKVYEAITGRRGVFKQVVETLDRLSKRKIKVEVKGVFSQHNIGDYTKIKEIALQYGDFFRWGALLMGAFPGCQNVPQKVRISAEQLVKFEQQDKLLVEFWKDKFKKLNAPNLRDGAFRCGVGGRAIHIDAFGGMHPCLSLESLKYDLLKGSLSEGWKTAIPKMLAELPWAPGPCQSCGAAEVCASCPAFAILENCSVTGPIPYCCELVKARAEAFGVPGQFGDLPGFKPNI